MHERGGREDGRQFVKGNRFLPPCGILVAPLADKQAPTHLSKSRVESTTHASPYASVETVTALAAGSKFVCPS